jgi:hypothetical protein
VPTSSSPAHQDAEVARVRGFEDVRAKAQRGELLTAKEFATILGIGKSQFNRRELAGAYDDFKVTPAYGAKRFSGELVIRWLAGEAMFADCRGVGRKRGVR